MASSRTIKTKNDLSKKRSKDQLLKTTKNTSPEPASINKDHSKTYAIIITSIFFLVALSGLYFHEMWRDEHQAWMVARDADTLGQLFQNLKYEGNPGLWHLLLFVITKFTSNPVFMQGIHLIIACSFIYIFNRHAPFNQVHKVLFSFGYLPLYEYAVISRSYGLTMLLFFVCVFLFKERRSQYILLGGFLALLANVTSFSLILASCLATIIAYDYYKSRNYERRVLTQFSIGILIFLIGAVLSAYQIYPEKDNSFPAQYPSTLIELNRMGYTFSNLFTTYFYLPGSVDIHFWNTNIYLPTKPLINVGSFSDWITANKQFVWVWWILPLITMAAVTISLLKKPVALLFYLLGTFGLLALFYYTGMAYNRYTGHLLLVLIGAYWISYYYQNEKVYNNSALERIAKTGKSLRNLILSIILLINVIAALIAYLIDINYKFTPSKDVATYIKENKLDQFPMIGFDDFITSPIASYLNTTLHYPEMGKQGSFIIWSNDRKVLNFETFCTAIQEFMSKGHKKAILIKATVPQLHSGNLTIPMERAIIKGNIKLEMIQSFEPGIVKDEQYHIYTVEIVDPNTIDQKIYPVLN